MYNRKANKKSISQNIIKPFRVRSCFVQIISIISFCRCFFRCVCVCLSWPFFTLSVFRPFGENSCLMQIDSQMLSWHEWNQQSDVYLLSASIYQRYSYFLCFNSHSRRYMCVCVYVFVTRRRYRYLCGYATT